MSPAVALSGPEVPRACFQPLVSGLDPSFSRDPGSAVCVSSAGAGMLVFVNRALAAAPGGANWSVAGRRMDRRWCVATV